MLKNKNMALVTLITGISLGQTALANNGFCPRIKHDGTIDLGFNPAMLHIDYYQTDPILGVFGLRPGLTVSSFYNAYPNPDFNPADPGTGFQITLWERDLEARIAENNATEPDHVTVDDVEVITTL